MKHMGKRALILLLAVAMILSMSSVWVIADEEEDLEDFFSDLMDDTEEETEEYTEEIPDSAATLADAVKAGTVETLENGAVKLQLDKATGYLYVTNKASGKMWVSNPYDAELDETASGITRTNLRAQLVVTYIQDDNPAFINNFVGSTNHGGAGYTVKGNTIRADYAFSNDEITEDDMAKIGKVPTLDKLDKKTKEKIMFVIPVEYALTDDGFEAHVLFGEIKDSKKIRVNKVNLLPYFGAAGVKEKGYMLIPDGSGALVDFNNGKVDYAPYEKAFYGGDKSSIPNTKTAQEEDIMVPVYGMKKGKEAFVATVTAGAECASLYACVAGKLCDYNRIYTEAVYRTYDTVNLQDAIGKSVYAKYTALDSVSLPRYSIRYTLLTGKEADYVGMAKAARAQLLPQSKKETASDTKLYVDFYGATEKEKAFLGIRYTGVQELTTFDEAKEMLQQLKKDGVKAMEVGYRNVSPCTYGDKLSCRVDPSGDLGGQKAYESLLSYAKDNGINVYPYADFVTFRNNGNSYYSFSDVIMGLELSVIQRYPFKMTDGQPDDKESGWYLVAGNKFADAREQLLKTVQKSGSTGVLLDESVRYIYNDFSPHGCKADQTREEMTGIYDELVNNKTALMMAAPNAYALPYAASLTDIPMTSSRYYLFDQDVPFLQIMLKGYIPYSCEALNINGVSDTTLLQLIETGSHPKFAMIRSEGKYLLRTDLTDLYGATFEACHDTAVSYYKEVSEVFDKIGGGEIAAHKRTGDLVTVTYDNGVTVYINYAENEAKAADGTVVPARGYFVAG